MFMVQNEDIPQLFQHAITPGFNSPIDHQVGEEFQCNPWTSHKVNPKVLSFCNNHEKVFQKDTFHIHFLLMTCNTAYIIVGLSST